MDNKKTIFKFLNELWKFIKHTELPANNDIEGWDKVVEDASELTAEYKTSDPLHVMFRVWTCAALQYMSDISKGVPTLMQECNEVKKAV